MKSHIALLRIDPAVRDRLRDYCLERGLIMGTFASRILDSFLKARTPETIPATPEPDVAGAKPKPRRK